MVDLGEEMMEKRARAKMAEAEIRWKVKMEISLEISFCLCVFWPANLWVDRIYSSDP